MKPGSLKGTGIEQIQAAAWMFDACLPLGPCTTSKLTFWPSLRVLNPFIWIAEKCANRSSPPSSGVMNPKPFASLNHLTVPVDIPTSPVTHVPTTSTLEKLNDYSLQPSPPHKLTIGIFSNICWLKKVPA